MIRKLHTLLLVFLVGCSSPSAIHVPAPVLTDYRATPSVELWQTLTNTTSTQQVMLAESELAVRGETSYGAEYLGRRTGGSVSVAQYSRAARTTGDRNCSDFSSAGEAQRYFLSAGGPSADPSGLDHDGDGFACEFGKILTAGAKSYRPKSVSVPRLYASQSSSGQCFTGPRGGTYTITASGNKNYNGC
jgi:hypothetical protein